MAGDFIARVRARVPLNDRAAAVLTATGVTSWEELDSLLRTFPSMALQWDLPSPQLSYAAHVETSENFANYSREIAAFSPTVSLGALPPPSTAMAFGANAGVPTPPEPMPQAAVGGAAALDLRPANWPVRDQGDRGTCVAFGASACMEFDHGFRDLSEQFLYWAIKTGAADPYPQTDGTRLEFARIALATAGLCDESLAPYIGAVVAPVSGARPTPAAMADAASRIRTGGFYRSSPGGAAGILLNRLTSTRKPVAICLPVFFDVVTRKTNWTTPIGWSYGRVLNPPPGSIVDGGHCVCVTGFHADPQEPAGGYFIIRNSWGTIWGARNPAPGGHAAEPGYGSISASYVDTYCWELFQP